jgi:hypothetical protein
MVRRDASPDIERGQRDSDRAHPAGEEVAQARHRRILACDSDLIVPVSFVSAATATVTVVAAAAATATIIVVTAAASAATATIIVVPASATAATATVVVVIVARRCRADRRLGCRRRRWGRRSKLGVSG